MNFSNEISQPGFMLFWEDLSLYAECLTAEELGNVLLALLADHEQTGLPALGKPETLAFRQLAMKIGLQAQKYRAAAERSRRNGKKHTGSTRKESADAEPGTSRRNLKQPGRTQTNLPASTETETETKTETVTETESKTETETETVTETERETEIKRSSASERKAESFSAAPLSALLADTDPCEEDEKKKERGSLRRIPSLSQISDYIVSHGLHVDAEEFFRYYDAGHWHDRDGNPVRSWRQKLLTWDSKNRSRGRPETPAFAFERAPENAGDGVDWLML